MVPARGWGHATPDTRTQAGFGPLSQAGVADRALSQPSTWRSMGPLYRFAAWTNQQKEESRAQRG